MLPTASSLTIYLRSLVPYATASFIAAGFVMLWILGEPRTPGGIIPVGGDYLWTQAMFESVGQVGLFAENPALNWPDGLSVWSHPQLGIFVMFVAWVLVAPLGFGSGIAVYLALVVVAGACAAATLFLFRAVVGARSTVVSVALACSAGASPFVLEKSGHLSVAAFFLVPLSIGSAIRFPSASRASRWAYAILVLLAAAFSPLWWVVVCLMIVAVAAVPWLMRRSWTYFVSMGVVGGSLLLGLVFQSLLYRAARIDGQLPTRGPWDSNNYGGHLTDLALSSPFLNAHFPRLSSLSAGASVEMSHVGIVGAFAAALCVLVVVAIPPLRMGTLTDTAVLAAASVSSVLWFLLGGLGNLQAAAAVFLGGTSPARVWARLIVVLAVLGATWLIAYLDRWGSRRTGWVMASVVAATAAVGATLDASKVVPFLPEPRQVQPEYAAVEFLVKSKSPCPVAQLPLDGTPMPRLFDGTDATWDLYLRPHVPYLLAPEFSWSFGPYLPERLDNLNAVPVEFTTKDLDRLRQLGFCAVLFDKELAKDARSYDRSLQGRDPDNLGDPSFSSTRYDVYLLDQIDYAGENGAEPLPGPVPEVSNWGPRATVAGQDANPQPSGESGIWIQVRLENATGVNVEFGEHRVWEPDVTEELVTFLVPDEWIEVPGSFPITIIDGKGLRIPVGDFAVLPTG